MISGSSLVVSIQLEGTFQKTKNTKTTVDIYFDSEGKDTPTLDDPAGGGGGGGGTTGTQCGGVETSILKCPDQPGGTCSDGSAAVNGMCETGDYVPPKNVEDTGLWGVLILAMNILTAGVGVAAIAGIVWGSVLYTTASGKPEQVKKANMVIANTVLGIVMYALMYSFLNFIIPGGMF